MLSGRGFLLSEGVELQVSDRTGVSYARLPLSFRNNHKNDAGEWEFDREIRVDATVFGPLAEYLADNVTGRQDLWVSGEPYMEEYEGKTYVRLNVLAAAPVGKPRAKAAAGSNGKSGKRFPF
ncbi:hypothetical protein BST11_25500 [Mycobacterium alsense]|uniref:Single-stranded DNA-binding protein n=1 Tax=Mycobacterium alsense TaxID=324058 RepID=A0ABX3R1R7_9MYCO|nr:hypothetical protein BST11_25500 [Mycobacterium alsense]